MISYFSAFFLLLFIPLGVSSTFATVDDFTTDQSVYYDGDVIRISGTVSSDLDAPNVSIVIFDPARSTFVTLGSAIADSDGNFSTTVVAGGGLWTNGDYPIQVTSEGTSIEKSIEYKDLAVSNSETSSESLPTASATSDSPTARDLSSSSESLSSFVTLKLKVPNFPSLDKSPQYYLDRYDNEPKYKAWFDSQFPLNVIHDVVGYADTHVDNFPSLDKSPQYYLDRYDNEPKYKAWFDSQFPGSSIHNVLGYSDPVPIPDWIRDDAEKWATGAKTTSDFLTDIEFMLENDILVVPNISTPVNLSEDKIPSWIRNNAHWWSQDLISEEEFVSSLEFLLKEEILSIK